MEFQFNERERAFRDEIDAFVREWLPPDWPEGNEASGRAGA